MPSIDAACIPCTSTAFASLSAEILGAGTSLRFRARGVSMSPLIRDGDVLLVRPVGPGSLQVGDVVLYSSEPGRILVHRIIGKGIGREGSQFTVQGDALSRSDGSIAEAQVYGRVVTIERGGVEMSLDRPLMKVLGRAAALRSRCGLGRRPRSRFARRLVKRLPVLSQYLG